MILRQNDWKQYPLGVMPSVRRHMDQHLLRAVPSGSEICRPVLMNALAAIVHLSRSEALLLARTMVTRVAAQPLSFQWMPEGVKVQLSGAVYASGTWPNPALLAFMTADLSTAAPPEVVPPPH
jgi:hypothetical protein